MSIISDTINNNSGLGASPISDAINGIGGTSAIESAINNATNSSGLNQAFDSGEVAFNSGVILTGGVEKTDTGNINPKWQNIGILFDYIQDETSTVEAEITDNWVESNWTYQDHIAIKPRIYRVRGCVGEVIHENISAYLNTFDDFKQKHPVFQKTMGVVNGISMFSGTVSNYTQAAMNLVEQVESSIDRYKNIYNNFTKSNQIRGKRQATLYETLVYMMQNRVPVKLTKLAFGEEISPKSYPYDKQFFIQSVSARQGDNAFISDIEVVIKEIRIAVTTLTKVDSSQYAGFEAVAKTEQSNTGTANGEEVEKVGLDKAKESVKKYIDTGFKTKDGYTLPQVKLIKVFYTLLKGGVKAALQKAK